MRRALSPACVLCIFFAPPLFAGIDFAPQNEQVTPAANGTPAEQRCVVQGHVTNSQTGEPLKKVTLHLVRSGSPLSAMAATHAFGNPGYSTSSEADGGFRFEGVEPGTYTLAAERPGYLAATYGTNSPRSPGKTLVLAPAQQLTDFSFTLTREAVISGKVFDEDGDPVPDANVQVLTGRWMRGKLHYMPSGGTSTNDLGEFRISHLGPGKYYLYAEQAGWMREERLPSGVPGKPDIRPVRTFYPDAMTRANATLIEIKAGQDAPGMDIHLHSTAAYHVRGKIAGVLPEGEPESLGISIMPRDDEMPTFVGPNSTIRKDLTFEMDGVAPGAYTLTLFKMDGVMRPLAHLAIEVGASDVNGVVWNIVPLVTVHGQIRLEGTPPPKASNVDFSNIHVYLMPVDRASTFGEMENAKPKADGSFTFENISPGKYYVRASGSGGGTYVKEIRFGQEDIYGRELDLNSGSSAELDVVFRYGPAEISGTVNKPTNANDAPDSHDGREVPPITAMIILVSDAMDANGLVIRQSPASQRGSFFVPQLRPGHYRAYAFEQVDTEQLQNPDVLDQLQSKAVDVDVKERDNKQIELTLISAEELHQVLARLGVDMQ